jgi:hypothetical protein
VGELVGAARVERVGGEMIGIDDRIYRFMCELGIGDDMQVVLLAAIDIIAARETELEATKDERDKLYLRLLEYDPEYMLCAHTTLGWRHE